MYFCKTIAIFPRHISFFFQSILYGYLHLLSFQKIYSLSGFLFKVSPYNGANAKRSFGVGCYLKSLKSWLLKGGPLSLLNDTGMTKKAKVLSICGIFGGGDKFYFHPSRLPVLALLPADTLRYGWGPRSLPQHCSKAQWDGCHA